MQIRGQEVDKRCPPDAPHCETPEERAQNPKYYWCIGFDDGPTEYYWDEIKVTEEEYKNSGQPSC